MKSVDDELGLLAAVGLTELEERIYRDLVKWNGGTVDEVAERAQVSPRRAREAVVSLERKGLLGRSSRPAGHYVASSPETALEILVLRRAEELERVRLLASQLKPEAASSTSGAGADQVVELIHGGEAITSRHYQLLLSARHELMGFATAPVEPITEEFVNFKLSLLDRGIKARHVCAVDVLETPGFVDFVAAVGRKGEQTRTVPSLPMHMLIVDRRAALVPVPSERKGRYEEYMAFKASALVNALVVLFEKVWAEATPFQPGVVDGSLRGGDELLSDDDRRLLSLLAAGLKDSAIASLMGIGHRTVERRVRAIMDLLGTQSRFQTGVAAARRGWLEAAERDESNGSHAGSHAGPHLVKAAARA